MSAIRIGVVTAAVFGAALAAVFPVSLLVVYWSEIVPAQPRSQWELDQWPFPQWYQIGLFGCSSLVFVPLAVILAGLGAAIGARYGMRELDGRPSGTDLTVATLLAVTPVAIGLAIFVWKVDRTTRLFQMAWVAAAHVAVSASLGALFGAAAGNAQQRVDNAPPAP